MHEVGGKIFLAVGYNKKIFDQMGDLLDLAVTGNRPDPILAGKFHGVGHQVFNYSYPHVGEEEPETFRRNYGLLLWKAIGSSRLPWLKQ